MSSQTTQAAAPVASGGSSTPSTSPASTGGSLGSAATRATTGSSSSSGASSTSSSSSSSSSAGNSNSSYDSSSGSSSGSGNSAYEAEEWGGSGQDDHMSALLGNYADPRVERQKVEDDQRQLAAYEGAVPQPGQLHMREDLQRQLDQVKALKADSAADASGLKTVGRQREQLDARLDQLGREAQKRLDGAPRPGEGQPTNPAEPTGEVDPTRPVEETREPSPQTPLDQARQKFMDTMKTRFDEERVKRVENLAREMERRMAARGYARILNGNDRAETAQMVRKQLEETYAHLDELAGTSGKSGEYFNQDMRAQLAENFLFHAADPTNVDQGQNGTCWLESGYIAGGFVNHPESMARFLKEVSLNGSFNATDGRNYKFPPHLFRFGAGDEEGRWTVGNANQDGRRSPVGLIYDEAMSSMVGRRDPDAGSYEGSVGCRRILQLVTGDTVHDSSHLLNGSARQTLMEKGAYIVYQPGHMRTVQMRIDGDFELGESDITKKHAGPTQGAIIQDNQWGEYNDGIDMVIHDLESNKIVDIRNVRNTPFSPNSVTGERPLPGYSPDGSLPDWDRNIGGNDGGGGFVPWNPGPGPVINPVDIVNTIDDLIDTPTPNPDDPAEVKNLIRTLTASAEGELQGGKPGQNVKKLKEAYEKVKDKDILDDELKVRVENVLLRAGQPPQTKPPGPPK